jgi:hypothetical protein
VDAASTASSVWVGTPALQREESFHEPDVAFVETVVTAVAIPAQPSASKTSSFFLVVLKNIAYLASLYPGTASRIRVIGRYIKKHLNRRTLTKFNEM